MKSYGFDIDNITVQQYFDKKKVKYSKTCK